MKRSTSFILCILFIVLSNASVWASPLIAAPKNPYELRVEDPAAPEYYEALMGLTPSTMAGYVFRESARVSAISEGFPSQGALADPCYAGRYICCHEGFVFVQQCIWDQGFCHNVVSHEPGIFDLSYGIYFGSVENEQGDRVVFVYNRDDNQLLLTLTLAERAPETLPLPHSVIGEWPELPDGAILLRSEYYYDEEGSYVDLFIRNLTEDNVLAYEEEFTQVNPNSCVLMDQDGLMIDWSTVSHVIAIPMDETLYLDEEGEPLDAAALWNSAATRVDAPAEVPPSIGWGCNEFEIQLYDEWIYEEDMSGDTFHRFIPEGDDRQGIMIDILPVTLDDFSAQYDDYLSDTLEGWATSYEVLFEGDAHWDAFPGALTLTFDVYNDSGLFAKLSIIAFEDNYADTYVLTYWEELEHPFVPSYYDQAMRIFESLTFLQ
ncbi:MAG: hypothetical protein QM296_11195 [Bacillota bacterium]|nr:hypothetical protein [Bacillota bacterium]